MGARMLSSARPWRMLRVVAVRVNASVMMRSTTGTGVRGCVPVEAAHNAFPQRLQRSQRVSTADRSVQHRVHA
eukprot:6380036-Pyramimonas_sp.AAC.1